MEVGRFDDVGWRRRCATYGVIGNDRQILQHRQWGRLLSLAQRCGGRGTERSSEIGRVNLTLCPHARARGTRRFQRALRQTDRRLRLKRNADRPARAGCWSTSPFSGLLLADSGSGRRWSSPAPADIIDRPLREPRGHRQQIGKSAALTVGALTLARAALRRPRH